MPSDIALDESFRFSSGSLVRNCSPSIRDDYGQGPIEIPEPLIFDPATGELEKIEPPLAPVGTELLEAGCLASGTEEDPGVSIRMYLRTPSKGLDPESFESRVFTYTLETLDDPVVATLDFPSHIKSPQGFMAGTGGNLLYAPPESGGLRLIKPDGTLIRDFAVDYQLEYVDEHIFVTSSVEKRDYRRIKVQQGHYGVTGEPADFANGEGELVGTWFGGFTLSRTEGVPARTLTTIVDTRARRAYQVDDMSTSLVWSPYAVEWAPNLSVVNLETGETVLERDADQTRGLGIERLHLAGKYLYILNEEDSPVIDLTTGEQVASGWGRRPTEPVTSRWMVVTPFDQFDWQNDCFHDRALPAGGGGMYTLGANFACKQGGTLVYSPEGYQGPWF